jgi:hypothetical protein
MAGGKYWTVVNAEKHPLVLVEASTPSRVIERLRCEDLWRSGCQIRESSNEEFAHNVAQRIILQERPTEGIYWIKQPGSDIDIQPRRGTLNRMSE